MFFKKRIHIIVLLGLLSFQTLFGQNYIENEKDSIQKYNLKEVVVTATRTDRELSALPLQVQLIREKELRRINSSRLSGVLSEQTGLVTIPGHMGGEGIQMQGLDAAYTLILIDGQPLVGRAIGVLDLNRISVGDIKQIEIVKGASSSLYGSEALGGVINIISQSPQKGLNTSVNYQHSTFNTNDAWATISYKEKKWDIKSFINFYSTKGYNLSNSDIPTVTPYTNITSRSNFAYRFSKHTTGNISFRYFQQSQDYILSSTQKGKSQINEWNTHFNIDKKHNEQWKSFFEFYATHYKTHEYIDNGLTLNQDKNSDFKQLLIRPEFRSTFSPNMQTDIVFGIGTSIDQVEKTIFITDTRMISYYTYGQWERRWFHKINTIIGFRYDLHSEYKSQFSPKIALKYDFDSKITIKTSIGYGYKAPDFRQLYNNFSNSSVGYTVLGNKAISTVFKQMIQNGEIATTLVYVNDLSDKKLSSESSVSFNFGVDVKPSSNMKINVNIFRNDIKNLIDTQIIAIKTSGGNVYSYYNAQKIFTQGMEVNATYKPTENIQLSVGYQLLYAMNKEEKENFEKGKVYLRDNTGKIIQLSKNDYFGLANRSRHSTNFKLYYDIPKWKTNTNVRMIYRSKYALTDTNNNNAIDRYDYFVKGYVLFHFAINKQLGKHTTIGAGVNNLLNYTDPQNISNLPGKTAYINLNINF